MWKRSAEAVRSAGRAAVSNHMALREYHHAGEKLDTGSRRQRLTLLCFVSSVALRLRRYGGFPSIHPVTMHKPAEDDPTTEQQKNQEGKGHLETPQQEANFHYRDVLHYKEHRKKHE